MSSSSIQHHSKKSLTILVRRPGMLSQQASESLMQPSYFKELTTKVFSVGGQYVLQRYPLKDTPKSQTEYLIVSIWPINATIRNFAKNLWRNRADSVDVHFYSFNTLQVSYYWFISYLMQCLLYITSLFIKYHKNKKIREIVYQRLFQLQKFEPGTFQKIANPNVCHPQQYLANLNSQNTEAYQLDNV